jgi:endo-beta-N-acetylglucosaminidase D
MGFINQLITGGHHPVGKNMDYIMIHMDEYALATQHGVEDWDHMLFHLMKYDGIKLVAKRKREISPPKTETKPLAILG